jgi:hypothetical protein
MRRGHAGTASVSINTAIASAAIASLCGSKCAYVFRTVFGSSPSRPVVAGTCLSRRHGIGAEVRVLRGRTQRERAGK